MNPDLMAQLRDIHSAPAVPWWPPAPGWWLVALLVLAVLVWFGRRLLARYRVYQRRQQMLGWVDHLNATVDPHKDPYAYLSTLNRVFKVVALRAFPGQQVAVMAGPQWTEFLQQHASAKQSVEALAVLATGPYQPAPQFDSVAISELARAWIKQHG
jgi:hypothetical protein